jgi:hypothetical protein
VTARRTANESRRSGGEGASHFAEKQRFDPESIARIAFGKVVGEGLPAGERSRLAGMGEHADGDIDRCGHDPAGNTEKQGTSQDQAGR